MNLQTGVAHTFVEQIVDEPRDAANVFLEASRIAPSAEDHAAFDFVAAEPGLRGLHHLVWHGIDILDEDNTQENTLRFGQMDKTSLIGRQILKSRKLRHYEPAVVHIEVMGLQDTGTNLLSSLMANNFYDQVAFYGDGAEFGGNYGVWKHANMAWVGENCPLAFTNLRHHHVVPIVMVRNPLSWLQSIRKAPYELQPCIGGERWLETPCHHRVPAGKHHPCGQAHFEHLSSIWGEWTGSYRSALGKYFNHSLLLSYEDLVLHTEDVLRSIAQALNLTLPQEIDLVQEPAKTHGAPLGREAATSKIEGREYLSLFTAEELAMVCEQLQNFSESMISHRYRDCFAAWNMTEGETASRKASSYEGVRVMVG